MKESQFQAKLIKKLKAMYPGCLVFKTDPNYFQGSPDLLILYKDKWVALECKRSADASKRTTQPYYINLMNSMSFAAFIYPENEEEVLHGIDSVFGQ